MTYLDYLSKPLQKHSNGVTFPMSRAKDCSALCPMGLSYTQGSTSNSWREHEKINSFGYSLNVVQILAPLTLFLGYVKVLKRNKSSSCTSDISIGTVKGTNALSPI